MQTYKTMTRTELIEDFLSELSTEIDVLYFVDADNVDSYDDIYQEIQDNGGFDIEIIYYSNAMEYLLENDSSLHESISIASEQGYETSSLNSELLASLLASRKAEEDFYKLRNDIDDFFENLEL